MDMTIFEQVEWLRVNHKIWIKVDHFITQNNTVDWDFEIDYVYTDLNKDGEYLPVVSYNTERSYESPKQAYLAAFDYIKNNNLI